MLKEKKRLGEAPKKKRNMGTRRLDDDQFAACIQGLKDHTEQEQVETIKTPAIQGPIVAEQQKAVSMKIVDQILNIVPHQLFQPQILPEPIKQIPIVAITEQSSPSVKPKGKPKQKVQASNPLVSSNWAAFLKTQKKHQPKSNSSSESQYTCMDCEYVECETGEEVVRISIVNQHLTQLYESYIRPKGRILDYRTDISGVTYTHIKGAPLWQNVRASVQKILYNKILVGHTIQKDLQVLGMEGWFGFKDVIDINKYSQYQENGKLQSLKKLAFVFLQKNIQAGMHSSLQDAKTTMELFMSKKEKILQELQRVRKDKLRILKKQDKASVKRPRPDSAGNTDNKPN